MRRILAVAAKELRQVLRDPLTLLMLLGLPAFMLVVFGYAISFDVEHVAFAVQDRDRSVDSRRLVDAFIASGRFDPVPELAEGFEAQKVIEGGRATLVLVIPERFGERLEEGREAPVQVLVDGTDASTATTLLGYVRGIVAQENLALLESSLERSGALRVLSAAYEVRARVWYNPELLSSHFLVPGLIGFILMITAVLSTALSVVREKERGTLELLRTTPLGTAQMLLGKTLPYVGISLGAMVFILTAARGLFGVEVRGSYLDLLVATILYLLGGFAFGLFISTLVDSQAIAFQIGIMASLLPTLLLSGFIFPIRNMPPALQVLTHLVPARYYLVVLRGLVLKGAPLGVYWVELACLALFAAALLTLAAVRSSRRRT